MGRHVRYAAWPPRIVLQGHTSAAVKEGEEEEVEKWVVSHWPLDPECCSRVSLVQAFMSRCGKAKHEIPPSRLTGPLRSTIENPFCAQTKSSTWHHSAPWFPTQN